MMIGRLSSMSSLYQDLLFLRQPQMLSGAIRHQSPARRSGEKSYPQKVRLIQTFYPVVLFGDGGGYGFESGRTAVILLLNRFQNLAVGSVKTQLVYAQHIQCFARRVR